MRLCQAFLPLIKRFTKPEEGETAANSKTSSDDKLKNNLLHETPKTPEELISLLEKIQKDAQANDFFKKIFEQDPVASENKFLTETMQTLQVRLHEGEQRYELMQRLNNNLVDELSVALSELDALKRTVVDSPSLVIQTEASLKQKSESTEAKKEVIADDADLVVPSFLRVMQAEQTLVDNFVYEEDSALVANHLLQLRLQQPVGVRRLDDSSEAEVENESSIP